MCLASYWTSDRNRKILVNYDGNWTHHADHKPSKWEESHFTLNTALVAKCKKWPEQQWRKVHQGPLHKCCFSVSSFFSKKVVGFPSGYYRHVLQGLEWLLYWVSCRKWHLQLTKIVAINWVIDRATKSSHMHCVPTIRIRKKMVKFTLQRVGLLNPFWPLISVFFLDLRIFSKVEVVPYNFLYNWKWHHDFLWS